jgi:hypothetical protein
MDYLVVENGKLKWNGSFEGLKDFVETTLGLKGKWSSPGGHLKLFREASESIVIRHYTNSASILVQGQNGEIFTKILMEKLSSGIYPLNLMPLVPSVMRVCVTRLSCLSGKPMSLLVSRPQAPKGF